jgi:hypothetical protein
MYLDQFDEVVIVTPQPSRAYQSLLLVAPRIIN